MFKWVTKKGSTIRLVKVGITNCYLVKTVNNAILIDTGQKRKVDKLTSFLKAYSDHQLKLDYLILTHTHYDHTQNANQIKKLYSLKVIVHQKEADFLKAGFTTLPKGTTFLTDFISSMGNKYASSIGKYSPVTPDIEFKDNYQLQDDQSIKLIHTPGHTIGSISILIDDEIAIVGDTLFGILPNKILPPFADDKNELIKSWKKLSDTNCDLFLPAHGKVINRKLLERELETR